MNELNSSAQQQALYGNVQPGSSQPQKAKTSKTPVIICIMLAVLMLFLAGYLVYYRISTTKANAEALTGTWVCNEGYNDGKYACGSLVYDGGDTVVIDGDSYGMKLAAKGMVITSGSDTYSLTYASNGGLVVIGGEDAAKLFGAAAGNISDSDYGVILHFCTKSTNLTQEEIYAYFVKIFKITSSGANNIIGDMGDYGDIFNGLLDLFGDSGSSGNNGGYNYGDILGDLFGGNSSGNGTDDILGGNEGSNDLLGDLFGGSGNNDGGSYNYGDILGDLFGGSSGSSGGSSYGDMLGDLFGGLFADGGGVEGYDDSLPEISDLF